VYFDFNVRLSKLCYAMICYAMLCYAMLCYAMLCCANVDQSEVHLPNFNIDFI
jgi:hypothetical protein